jgi:o-succinylbenzoate synthase
MDVELERVTYRFRQPITTAYGTLTEREVLVLRLRDEDGNLGLGEAAPLEPYDGVPLEATRDALLPALAELQAGASEGEAAWAVDTGLRQADAALDVALSDLGARADGRPGIELDERAREVPVNATIAATDRAGAAREAAGAAERGFRTVKLKVGVGDDAGRVAAVRAAIGPDVRLRLDANGAWTVDQAVAALRSLAASGIELCEEPVRGISALAEVRRLLDGEVAIAMDESGATDEAVVSGACEYVCLKIAACGGVSRLVDLANRARAHGSEVYVASTYDGPIGIAAGLHAAATLGPDIPACGLATLSLFEGIDDPFPVRDGRIEVPRGPGLGITWPVE